MTKCGMSRVLTALLVALALIACADETSSVEGATPEVVSFSLINADTEQPIGRFDPLPDGATLDLAALPTRNLSVRANTDPTTVGSVRFVFNSDTFGTKDAPPYARSQVSSGNFRAWTPESGSYSLTATPYTQAGAEGTAGKPLTVTFTVEATEVKGTPTPAGYRRLLYVFPRGRLLAYDMDNGYKLVKKKSIPELYRVWGLTAYAPRNTLYISYHDRTGKRIATRILAYDLVNDKVLWRKQYRPFVDSLEITPDGKTIYMATGEATNKGTFWFVIDAMTGRVKDTIPVFRGAHNTIVSLDGKRVYMGSTRYPYLVVANTATNKVIRKIGPMRDGVRPFTINGRQTLAFINVNHFLGFEVGDINTGKRLYSVRVKGFPERRWRDPLDVQSHGVALTPDEKELWVADNGNKRLHIFDVTGLPGKAPVQLESIRLSKKPNWIAFSRDGRFAHASTGDIINTKTRQVVAKTASAKQRIQIDFVKGEPVKAYSRYGLGYVTGK